MAAWAKNADFIFVEDWNCANKARIDTRAYARVHAHTHIMIHLHKAGIVTSI